MTAFVAARDASAHDSKRKPVALVKPPMIDYAAIKAFLAKRKLIILQKGLVRYFVKKANWIGMKDISIPLFQKEKIA
ncbi:hypothetical protein [uncultured Acetatifactor sp.]|jgi:hypothetical protein|uniref:hypothetical protein n=1 Tax=uncultured Acetatifactor sp. TaxID=1671927 RepID=UPI00262DD5AA|nr:hypothetical protein [uncultured Acetatifactor sp.]